MLVPLIHTCATVIYVYSTIPILPEEQSCLITCCILLASPIVVILLAALQHFLFRKYNTSGHTWKMLLSSRRMFHIGVRLAGSSEWKIEEVEQRLSEVWQDSEDPKDARAKVTAIRVERLVEWGQPEEDRQGLWKAVVTVCPELDFPTFETMARANEGEGIKVEKLVREELQSGSEEEEEEETADSRNCMCSCNPQVKKSMKIETLRGNSVCAAGCIIEEAKKGNCNSAKVKGRILISGPFPHLLLHSFPLYSFGSEAKSLLSFCLGFYGTSVKLCQSHVFSCEYCFFW